MSFTEVYASILSPFVKKYEEAKNDKGRKAVVSNAVDAVLKSRNLFEDEGDSLPKDLPAVCLHFFFFLCPFLKMLIMTSGYHSLYQRLY